MNSSILNDFHVVESPVSSCRLNLDEFSSVSTPLQSAYCRQMTEAEYEAMGDSETDKQLKVIAIYIRFFKLQLSYGSAIGCDNRIYLLLSRSIGGGQYIRMHGAVAAANTTALQTQITKKAL
jgi:hypothetical protein